MRVEIDNENHCGEFIRLNERWIEEHFSLEEVDRKLAEDPFRIVRDGGHIVSLVVDGRVVGVCALFRESAKRFELARMAVDPRERGKGYGDALIRAAIELARKDGAKPSTCSRYRAEAAIALYRKHGFHSLSEGPHPVYVRCNIVMERSIAG